MCINKTKFKDMKHKELIKIILHYRSIHKNGDLSKRHWNYLYEELNNLIYSNEPNEF